MTRFVMFCTGLVLMCSMTGCCLHGGGGYGAGYPGGGCGPTYGAPGYGGGCPGGACGAAAPGYPSAFAPGGTTAFAPMGPTTAFAPAYPQAAMVPIETLPTY